MIDRLKTSMRRRKVNKCFFHANAIKNNNKVKVSNLNIIIAYSSRTKAIRDNKEIESNLAGAGLNSNHVERGRRTASNAFRLQEAFPLVQHRGHTLLLR